MEYFQQHIILKSDRLGSALKTVLSFGERDHKSLKERREERVIALQLGLIESWVYN